MPVEAPENDPGAPEITGRRKTRSVKVGRVIIGGGFPISVQTMWKEPLLKNSLPAVLKAIERLSVLGCDILRFAVPDVDSAECLGRLSDSSALPIVADVHFDYRLAMRCLDFTISKIRINPGNIGEEWKVKEVIAKAAGKGVPLRIGVNSGSLPNALVGEQDVALAMLRAAEMEMEILEKTGFREVVFSLKSPDVDQMIRANTMFAEKYDYPLHLGVTEAGPLIPGIVRNAIGISDLLKKGIGDTIRVSLTSAFENEVLAGLEILRAVNKRESGVTIVSCPKCGRSSFDVQGFLEDVSEFIKLIKKPITVAVMGCPVNGPGEAKRCDLGITGAGNMAVIFRHGEIVKRVSYSNAVDAFKEEVAGVCGKP